MGEETALVNFNCPKRLLEEFDKAIKGRYSNRTEAILDGMRRVLRELNE
jgi:metal-responsive CopG/Arc/MetJ family transcriptional regulator